METKTKQAKFFIEIQVQDGETFGVTTNLGELKKEVTYQELISKQDIEEFIIMLKIREVFDYKSARYITKAEYIKEYGDEE